MTEAEKKKKAEQAKKDDAFLTSAVVGAVTDSTIIGAVVGGSVVGAILGDLFNGGKLDD